MRAWPEAGPGGAGGRGQWAWHPIPRSCRRALGLWVSKWNSTCSTHVCEATGQSPHGSELGMGSEDLPGPQGEVINLRLTARLANDRQTGP